MPDERSDASARLFVAVVPPPEVVRRLASELARPPLVGVRYTTPDQWHVTLRFLGRAPLSDAARALASLDTPVAEVTLGPATARLGRRVVCLPAAGLEPLAAAVEAATAGVGRPPERRAFTGHLTLARLGGAPADGLVGVPFEAAFAVGEVQLVRSRTLPGGAVYDVVASRPLAGGAPAAPH